MTDYLSLTEFIPGTKAKAEEVNANFSALKDAINERAFLNGDNTKTFAVAEGTENTHAVRKSQLDAVSNKATGATKFCCNKGIISGGTPALLSYANNTVTLNSTGAMITDHLGITTALTNDATLDVTGITGNFYIFYKTSGTLFKTANPAVFSYSRPAAPVDDTVYLYTNNNVWTAELYKNATWTALEGIAYLGSFTAGGELLPPSGWTSTGWSGSQANGWAHTTGNTSQLSNSITATAGLKYQINYTVTGRTAGSFSISFGGNSANTLTASGIFYLTATSTTALVVTPTSDFNGTVSFSLKVSTLTTNPYNQNGYNINSQTVKKYDSGWFPVSANTTYTKSHNLGTTNFKYSVFIADDINGTNQRPALDYLWDSAESIGYYPYLTDNTTLSIKTVQYVGRGGSGDQIRSSAYYRIMAEVL